VDDLLSASDDRMKTIGTTIDRQIELDPRTESCSTVSVKDSTGTWQTTITIVPVGPISQIQFSWSRLTGLQQVRT
jgi:hypothetical protein